MLDPPPTGNLPPIYKHRIRLAGPWRLAEGGSGQEIAGARAFRVPGGFQTLGVPAGQAIQLRRFFRWVAEREPNEEVDLILEGCSRALVVQLGDVGLGTVPAGQCGIFAITSLLRPANELILEAMPRSEPLSESYFGSTAHASTNAADGKMVSADGLWLPPLLAIRQAKGP